MSDPAALVAKAWDELDIAEAMRDLARLTRFDRYQASDGISAAADYVADRATANGLVDVEILRFPADGRTVWGTFAAPTPWTPRSASLAVVGGTSLVSYPVHAFGLASQSASTPDGGIVAPLVYLDGDVQGAIVLLSGPVHPALLEQLVERAAVGFAAAVRTDIGAAGRIELPSGTPLFGFSLTGDQYAQLSRAESAGRSVVARVAVDTSPTTMPVVTARTEGGSGEEILITAHLCHPAPSAGDNASGVAAALAIGRWLSAMPLRRPVRFVWGPEFVGLAAYTATVDRRPEFAISLDMVGQNPAVCGGPLTVERTPGHAPHAVDAVIAYCFSHLPASQRSYSGAVSCDPWTYRTTPFVGASDHAILADRAIGCPAIQIGHWPDRYNHSSADTIDKISPDELRRAATATAATVAAFAVSDDREAIAAITARHAIASLAECLPDPAGPPSSPDGWIDPDAADQTAYRLMLARDRALGQLGPAQWAYHQVVSEIVEKLGPPASPQPRGPVYKRTWPGPFNLRGLLAATTAEHRRAIETAMGADRGRGYATMMALAQAIDGEATWSEIVVRAAHEARLPIEYAFADRFRDSLLAAGWIA